MEVGIIGTGLMGAPIAEKFLEKGAKVCVFNRTKEKAERLANKGAKVFSTAAELIENCEVIFVVLSDYCAVCSALFENDSIDFNGKIIVQVSTISSDESVLLSERIENAGGEFIEAPVLGSIPQIKAGELIVLLGGSKERFEKYKNLFEPVSNQIHYIGEIGKASAVKLALNQLIASLTAAFSTSLGLVLKSGADVEKFMEILRASALYAPTFDKKLNRMLERNFDNPNFPVKHLLKDVGLIKESAEKEAVNSEVISAAESILQKAIEMKLSEKDYSALFNAVVPRE
ncbi:MAG: NAD(P)-dependent oxidoreductase [Chlorobi bacterium]|nr:NAD(P)-dependent oxidoreductase [Chlorobiota bacterium]